MAIFSISNLIKQPFIKLLRRLYIDRLDFIIYKNDQIIESIPVVDRIINEINDNVHILLKYQPKIVKDSSYFQSIESGLINYLYSFLPDRTAIDIGANRGDISQSLLETGYQVYAFEPFLPVYEKMVERFAGNPNFYSFPLAIGSTNETKEFHIASDTSSDNVYEDTTVFNSLVKHSSTEDLVFSSTVPVTVTTLEDLHSSAKIPQKVSLVKIDTEGFDLEVIRGMGNHIYDVVVAEFWDPKYPYAQSGTLNGLQDMVKEMKQRNYNWYLVIYGFWGSEEISYYCNHANSVEGSWGNVFFFQDYEIFNQAQKWCSSVIPPTFLRS